MELFDLEFGLKAVASGGHVLNCQELTGIQAGLTLLKSREKRREIFFWGKVFGLNSDYYLAYHLQDTEYEFPGKVFFYAGEDFEFRPLQRLTEDLAHRILELGVEKPFSGDAAKVLDGQEPAGDEEPPADQDEGQEKAPDAPPKLTELDRLSQVTQEIDFDTAVVPKGAHALNEAHVVVPSSSFKGLGNTEATSIAKYVHFRPPTSVACLRALARTDSQFYADFLDPLEGDLPKGCWAIRQDPSAATVSLRSLNWPGYVAFHIPGTTKFGGAYFGYGQRSQDLPFML